MLVLTRMLARLLSAGVYGVEAFAIHVEVDVTPGLPSFTMVGLPDATVRESRDRVRGAIRNSGYEFPLQRITVNLAPAEVRKAGAALDLPIAIGVLAATGQLDQRLLLDCVIIGELSLDGSLQPVRGVLPVALLVRRARLGRLVAPAANATEAALVEGLPLSPMTVLSEAGVRLNTEPMLAVRPTAAPPTEVALDMSDVRGQGLAKRALEIAAAGHHHTLLVGPPGTGKTMLARRLGGLLPSWTVEEAVEATAIHSVAGMLGSSSSILPQRPFRAPHHTISPAALVGGGSHPRPGEISLAHHGVLFPDEIPEFDRRALETLRQPIEEGVVMIARAARTASFPARFLLIGAMNPCPCGWSGHPVKECRCLPTDIARYHGRLSGPVRDRLDLVADVPSLPSSVLLARNTEESTQAIRARVCGARMRQLARTCATGSTNNACLNGPALRAVCSLDARAERLLGRAIESLALSARLCDRVLRVSRTIADLDGSERVDAEHLAEALQFRSGG